MANNCLLPILIIENDCKSVCPSDAVVEVTIDDLQNATCNVSTSGAKFAVMVTTNERLLSSDGLRALLHERCTAHLINLWKAA